MRILALGVENSLNLSIERPHDADPREHRRASQRHDQDHGFHCGLPFRRLVLGFGELCDVIAGVLKGNKLATAG